MGRGILLWLFGVPTLLIILIALRRAASLHTFISLLSGAFIACVASAPGARRRDEVPDLAA